MGSRMRTTLGKSSKNGWMVGVLGILMLASLSYAREVTIVAKGEFTTSGTTVLAGDTYVAEITYETTTDNDTPTSTVMGQYPGAVVGSKVTFKRDGVTYGTASCVTSNTIDNRVIIYSGYLGPQDDMGIYTRVEGTSGTGGDLGGRFFLRYTGAPGTMPSDLSIPETLPADGTWSGRFYTTTTLYHSVESVVQLQDYAAWTYEAPITSVYAGSALDGIAQVGDTLCGTLVLATNREPEGSNPEVLAQYRTSILIHEIVITRDGMPIWAASQSMDPSYVALEMASSAPNNQAFRINTPVKPVDDPESTSTFWSWMMFYDRDGSDMLSSTRIPDSVPENWEMAYTMIAIDGRTSVFASINQGVVESLDISGAKYFLEHVDQCLATVHDLSSEIDDLDSQIVYLNNEVSTLQADLTTANDDIADKQEQIDSLIAEVAEVEDELSGFVGADYSVWTYQAEITSKAQAETMGGAVQVGDVITGTVILDRNAPPAAPGDEFAYIRDSVVMAKAEVVRNGETIWRVDQPVSVSSTQIYTNIPPIGRQQILIDCQMEPQDGTTYRVLVQVVDNTDQDMFDEPKIPAAPPETWDGSHISIVQNGSYVAVAQLVPGSLKSLPINGHVAWEKELEAKATDLQQQRDLANADIAAKQAQIDALTADVVAKQAQIDTLASELATANADIAAKQAQIDTLTAEKAALQQQLADANAAIAALEQNVADLEEANAGLSAQVESVEGSLSALEAVLADEFNDPEFAIPGDTPEAKAENLKAAILLLNHGQRQALFRALGGDKNAK